MPSPYIFTSGPTPDEMVYPFSSGWFPVWEHLGYRLFHFYADCARPLGQAWDRFGTEAVKITNRRGFTIFTEGSCNDCFYNAHEFWLKNVVKCKPDEVLMHLDGDILPCDFYEARQKRTVCEHEEIRAGRVFGVMHFPYRERLYAVQPDEGNHLKVVYRRAYANEPEPKEKHWALYEVQRKNGVSIPSPTRWGAYRLARIGGDLLFLDCSHANLRATGVPPTDAH